MRGQWTLPGSEISGTNAHRAALHFFSNSGVDCIQSQADEFWTVENGMNFRPPSKPVWQRKVGWMADELFFDEPAKYERDDDGFRREIVGPWVKDKHLRLRRYVDISRAVRRKFIGAGKAGATYLDLFSGPGRVRFRDEASGTDGSPLIACEQASETGTAFSQVFVADLDDQNCAAVHSRLKRKGTPVQIEIGPAVETVDRVVSKLHPEGLHFAFLDPYRLADLDFEIIRKLAACRRMDILMHVSIQDLQRNLRRYIQEPNSSLDAFAPGWRETVDVNRQDHLVRAKLMEYWRSLLGRLGMNTAEVAELVVGSKNQRLYWLAFAARHDLALDFWEKIRGLDTGAQLKLL